MATFVTSFALAGSRVSLTGGLYAYVEVAFGPFIGFLAGVLFFLTAVVSVSGIVSLFTGSFLVLLPSLDSSIGHFLIALLVFGVLAGVNVRGVRGGTRAVEVVMRAASGQPTRSVRSCGSPLRPVEQRTIGVEPSAGGLLGTEVAHHAETGGGAQRGRPRAIGEQRPQRPGQRVHIARRHQQPIHPIVHHNIGRAGQARGDNGQPRRHRLEQRDRKPLPGRWQRELQNVEAILARISRR